jgi:hypothetical protein
MDLDWHLSGLAERNCFISSAFATICILAAVRTLVCDTPDTAAYPQRIKPKTQRIIRHLRMLLKLHIVSNMSIYIPKRDARGEI